MTNPGPMTRPASAEGRPLALICTAVAVFSLLSIYCAVHSEGFIAADACTHYMYSRFAMREPTRLVDVWARPLVTALYAVPAALGGRLAVRAVCLVVALACGFVAMAIGRGQGLRRPVLALVFTLGQPLLFLHSFGEMTELPFALLLGLGFLAYQRERYWLAAALVSLTPLARPEGFGFVAIAAIALLFQRIFATRSGSDILRGLVSFPRRSLDPRPLKRTLPIHQTLPESRDLLREHASNLPAHPAIVLLPIPLVIWDISGWLLTGRHGHVWRWLPDAWPYAGQSLYGSGRLLTFVGQLPAIVSPLVLPATLIGIVLSLEHFSVWSVERAGRVGVLAHHVARGQETHGGRVRPPYKLQPWDHARLCRALTALLPLFVLVVHTLLYWLGKLASFGEGRYLLVVAPFWGVLSARGWEWFFERFNWRHITRWACAAVLIPPVVINLLGRAVPVHLSSDWQIARQYADWYRTIANNEGAPSGRRFIMTAHPAIFYFLDISPCDWNQARGWDARNAATVPPATVLVWDPIYADKNASAAHALRLEDLRKAGWIELRDDNPLYNGMPPPPIKSAEQRNATDGHQAWHVFVSPSY